MKHARLFPALFCAVMIFSILISAQNAGSDVGSSLFPFSADPARLTAPDDDWLVLSLCRINGDTDISGYAEQLVSYLDSGKSVPPATKLRMALILHLSGNYEETVTEILDENAEKVGIMTRIFALHLLEAGASSEKYNVEALSENIISLQLENGGFAVTGTHADTDSTAMAIQVLAPLSGDKKIRSVCEDAVSFLASSQLDNGGFSCFGTENCESTAQVILALHAMGIDPSSDERFLKNGRDLYGILSDYRLGDGSYCHIPGGKSNTAATAQAAMAFVSRIRFENGLSPFYPINTADFPAVSEESTSSEPAKPESTDRGIGYKPIVCTAVALLCLIVCAVLFFMKKRSPKSYLAVLLIGCAVIAVVLFTDIESAGSYYSGNVTRKNVTGKVSLTVSCAEVAEKTDRRYIPENGILVDGKEYEISDGETVYDLMTDAARIEHLNLDISSGYVSGINFLYEFDFGELSGWLFLVNGKMPSIGCSDYVLSDGDTVEWIYTTDLGKSYGSFAGSQKGDTNGS